MATDVRKHTAPAAGEQPQRAAINLLSESVNDFVPVANATERAQLVADLTAKGYAPSTARPLVVWRADASPGLQYETTTDGTNWSNGARVTKRATTATSQGGITGVVTVANLSVTFPVIAGRRIRVAYSLHTASTVGSDVVQVAIQQDNVAKKTSPFSANAANAVGVSNTVSDWTCIDDATAGNHTYNLSISRVAGSGTVSINASALQLTELLVEDLGPVA